MNRRIRSVALGAAVLSIAWLAALAQPMVAQTIAAEVSNEVSNELASEPTIAGDLYQAGGAVRVRSEVDGDAVVAGALLTVAAPVSEDVLAAGGLVTITADAGDDLRLAGGAISILGRVGGDVTAAGGTVALEPGSQVSGRAWLAGRIVHVAGDIDGTLRITGGRVTLAGRVGGDVDIDADSIELEPGAVIGGRLIYAAPRQVRIGEGAVVRGEIERIEFAIGRVETWGPALAGKLKSSFGLVLSALVLVLLFPRFSARAVEGADASLLGTAGLGLAVLAAGPLVILLLVFSGIASPLAFLALGAYLALLFGGWLIGVLWIADGAVRLLSSAPEPSRWSTVGGVVVAALVLLVAGAIPYLGGLAVFATLLLGMGATSRDLVRGWFDGAGDRASAGEAG